MPSLDEIEKLTRDYAAARNMLSETVMELHARMDEVRRPMIKIIKAVVAVAGEKHGALKEALEASPELFKKPKTQTFGGVRVGYMKKKGKVLVEDEETTIKRIRKELPDDQVELLIRQTESVDKNALATLTLGDLKRLGVSVIDDTDTVTIKPVDSDVDKLVNALLADVEQDSEKE